VSKTNVGKTNVGKTNVGKTNVGKTNVGKSARSDWCVLWCLYRGSARVLLSGGGVNGGPRWTPVVTCDARWVFSEAAVGFNV
jgi:hypothetical protein